MSTMAVLKQRETVRELSAYLKQEVPPLYNALIAERDAYMANSILRSPGRRVVAVVGLAHVDGIEANVLQGGSRGVKPKAVGGVSQSAEICSSTSNTYLSSRITF